MRVTIREGIEEGSNLKKGEQHCFKHNALAGAL